MMWNQRIKLTFWVCVGVTLLGAAAAKDVDVLSYGLDVEVENDYLRHRVTISATARKRVRSLSLQLASSVEILSCRMSEQDVPYERSDWNLTLDLSDFKIKGEFDLEFELRGSPYNNQRNQFIRTVVSEEHTYIRSQYAWYPRQPDDLALYESHIRVRKDWIARTAGVLENVNQEGEHAVYHYVLDTPCRNIGLAAGEYVVVEGPDDGGVALNALVFPQHQEGAAILLETASQAVRFFASLYGEMSEAHFSLVEMPAQFGSGSGYGETGYALIGEGAFVNANEASWARSLVVHEVSHTWWGREVVFSNFANEMLATYATLRFIEQSLGADAARNERKSWLRRVQSVAASRPLPSLDTIEGWGNGIDPSVYTACAYDKAAMLLFMLEQEMGRDAFDQSVREFFTGHRGEIVDYRELKSAFGSRYKWMFAQWEEGVHPSLQQEHEASPVRSSYSVAGKLSQEGTDRPFRLNVRLRAIQDDQTFDHVVELKKKDAAFKFSCPFEPHQLVIDPDAELLCPSAGPIDVDALRKSIFQVVNSPKEGNEATLRKTIQNIRAILAQANEDESVFHMGLGRCLFRLGEHDAAIKEFEAALRGGAGGPFHRTWVHLRLGCIYDLKRDRKRAKVEYDKVLASSNAANHEYQKQLARKFLDKPYRGYTVDG